MQSPTPYEPSSDSSSRRSDDLLRLARALKRRRIALEEKQSDSGNPTVKITCKSALGNADDGGSGFITLSDEFHSISQTEHHLPRLSTFVDKLNDVYQPRWNCRSIPYTKVLVLLIYWEDDDLGVKVEIDALESIFRDTYRFGVEQCSIPSSKERYSRLFNKVHSFLTSNDSEDTLFILYYGGHAHQDGQSQPTWISRRTDNIEVQSSVIIPIFGELDADLLLIFDSCQAVPQAIDSRGKGVVAALTATGFEPTPIATAAEVGPHSFTHSLIEELGALSRPAHPSRQTVSAPFTDIALHSRLVARLKTYTTSLEKLNDGSFRRDENGHHIVEPYRRRTPIYTFLSRNKTPKPITLCPLRRNDDNVPQTILSPQLYPSAGVDYDRGQCGSSQTLHVLISLRLSSDELGQPDVDAWAKWVLDLPTDAEGVSIEAVYPSLSTLVIVKMPLVAWSLLRKDPAISLIGYLTGDNMTSQWRLRLNHLCTETQDTTNVGYDAAEREPNSGICQNTMPPIKENSQGEHTVPMPSTESPAEKMSIWAPERDAFAVVPHDSDTKSGHISKHNPSHSPISFPDVVDQHSSAKMESLQVEDAAVISDLKEQFKGPESSVSSMEICEKHDSILTETRGFVEVEKDSSRPLLADLDHRTYLPFLPKVRKCTFAEFKNRFEKDDARSAVDVLVSGSLFEQEYLDEQRLRDRLFERGESPPLLAKRNTQAILEETAQSNDALRNEQSGEMWIMRIRLQAPALLKILARVQSEVWSPRPRTYDRPFCTLLHFHPQVKKVLYELEEKWTAQNEEQQTETPGTMPRGSPNSLWDDDFLEDSQDTLEILRAYVKFIDEDVMPGSHRFENQDYTSDEKMLFSDLCYLFKPGEYIYKQSDAEKSGEGRDEGIEQRIWRVYFVNDAIRNYNLTPPPHHKYSTAEPSGDDSIHFTVHAYHVDYTGNEFCVVTHTFKISPFEGWRPVNALPIYPIRFKQHHLEYMENSLKIGEQVLRFIGSKHAFYDAWTVGGTHQGKYSADDEATGKHPEYIKSEVMVDFGEAFQACPSWRPKQTVLKTEFTNKIMIPDDFPILSWSGKDRTRLLRETREIIPYRTGVHHQIRNKFVVEDAFLAIISNNHQRGLPTTQEALRAEEKCLLYGRVFAYIFGKRKFAQLDVSKLTLPSRNLGALEALKIPPAIKMLIQGSVRGHSIQKKAEGRREEGMNLDIIQGKGNGLFILLHGAPGVGKTATAEAVAQAIGKPLFTITCGDIGVTPDQVEASLGTIFRLASTWDCILLLDEVDTFFSQRSKGDSAFMKNAVVSEFLRSLEYYNGILFLTSNRAGALDEAFKSRIHYKIYYPSLSREQTLHIWKLNIQRIRSINENSKDGPPLEIDELALLSFAEHQFDDVKNQGRGRWNGRQIRNAFQAARSLACYDQLTDADETKDSKLDSPRQPPVLDVKYFRMFDEINGSFDRYNLELFSGTTEMAPEMEERADDWAPDWTGKTPRQKEWDDRLLGYSPGQSLFNSGQGPDSGGRPRTTRQNPYPSITVSGAPSRFSFGRLGQKAMGTRYDAAGRDRSPSFPPSSPNPSQQSLRQQDDGPPEEAGVPSWIPKDYSLGGTSGFESTEYGRPYQFGGERRN